MPLADGDVVGVFEFQLTRNPPDLVVLDGADRRVRARHLEEAIEQREFLVPRGHPFELPADQKIIRTT